jgi:hypothetical protein
LTDKHYTTPALAASIVNRLIEYGDLQSGDRVLDPCVGLGAFANAVRVACPACRVVTIDLDPSVKADIHNDYLQVPPRDTFQLITSNPPFSLAQAFVERSVGICDPRGAVAFLLTLQFLGSSGRRDFFHQYPPSTIDVIRPRPSFALDGGTDAREYCLMRWCPQDFTCLRNSGARMGHLDWDKPRKIQAATAAE